MEFFKQEYWNGLPSGTISLSKRSSWVKDQTHVFCVVLHWQVNSLPLCYPEKPKAYHSYLVSSVPQSCPTLCDPMNHSTPRLPVHPQLVEFTQTHVHRVSDAIQPSRSNLTSLSQAGRWGVGIRPLLGELSTLDCLAHLFFPPPGTSWPAELPLPGVEPVPPVVEVQSLNHWTSRVALPCSS